jgi:prepilin-type N-terminal cleavage/methylation domain-containing protein
MIRRKDEGFTLVELMVVVLIIGILVAIAIPVFNAARANAETGSCKANLRTLDGAVQTWAAANQGAVPADYAAAQTALSGTYVKVWPVGCPTAPHTAYAYAVTGGGTIGSFTCLVVPATHVAQ